MSAHLSFLFVPDAKRLEWLIDMENNASFIKHAGAQALTLGILTLVFGVTVGVLNIVSGARLLARRADAPRP